MNNIRKPISLNRTNSPILLAAVRAGGIVVDAEAGEIRNVSVISRGPALGHGFEVDGVMMQQVADGINRVAGGLKVRFGHPSVGDAVGTVVGRISNARVEGDSVRADVTLGDYAAMLPGGGNAREYILAIAAEDPQFIGMSIVFLPAAFVERGSGRPLGRVLDVLGVDFVDDPAANRKGLLSSPTDVLAGQAIALDVGAPVAAPAAPAPPPIIRVGPERKLAALTAAIPDAICLRAGRPVEAAHELAPELSGQTVLGMFAHYLVAMGANESEVWTMSAPRLATQLLSQSTGDFAALLGDAINKSLRQAYLDAPSTWQQWARRATAPDFKTISRAALSEVPALQPKAEGAEIRYVTLGDKRETYALATYARGVKLTREALINDDLDAFGRVPMLQGSASRRLEDDVTYAVLTGNPTMADGVALFHATSHGNLAGSGSPLSVASIGAGRAAMAAQTGPKGGGPLGIVPRYLIIPTAIELAGAQITASTVDPSKANDAINPALIRSLVVVADPRLDAVSTTAWYLAADSRAMDTVEVCFLVDEPEPVTAQETSFGTGDVKFSVRHTVAAKAIDWRGLYRNPG